MEIVEDPVILELLLDECRKEVYEKLTHKAPPDDDSSRHFIEYKCPDGDKSVRYFQEFPLKDYSLIPIFFNSEKSLRDICILYVSDKETDAEYYYMLAKKGHGVECVSPLADPFSISELLSIAGKILKLDETSQSLKVFLDGKGDAQITSGFLFERTFGMEKVDEFFRFLQYDLRVASKNAARAFVNSYQLNENILKLYNRSGYLVIRTDSFCYKKLRRLLRAEKSVPPPCSIAPLLRAFKECEYLKREEILSSFHDHIRKIYETFSGSNPFSKYFAAVLVVLQSSGYGKSRTVIELGTKMPVFYSSIQDASCGFPPKSYYLNSMIWTLSNLFTRSRKPVCHVNTACAIIYTFFLRCIYVISKFPDDEKKVIFLDESIDCTLGNNRHANFSILFSGLERICEYGKINVEFNYNSPVPILLPEELNKFDPDLERVETEFFLPTANLEEEVVTFLKGIRNGQLPCLFVIDEALSLLDNSILKSPFVWSLVDFNYDSGSNFDSSITPYQVFRRTFRLFSKLWDYLWLVFISSSNGKIEKFFTDAEYDSTASVGSSFKLFYPFVLIHTYNCNSKLPKHFLSKGDENPYNSTKFPALMVAEVDKKYLESFDRVCDLFSRARPLITNIFDFYYGKGKDKEFVFRKYIETPINHSLELEILVKKFFTIRKVDDELSFCILPDTITYSILGLSVCLSRFPYNFRANELIENDLTTITKFDKIGEFLPEGPLNGAASWFLCKHLSDFILLLDPLISANSYNISLFWSYFARIILLACKFYSIDPSYKLARRFIFSSLELETFLKKLSGNEEVVLDFFTSNPVLKGSLVTFSYFQFFNSKFVNPYKVMLDCFINGSAAYFNYSFSDCDVDFLIPLILNDGRISFLAVKIRSSQLDDPATEDSHLSVYKKMRLSNMFGSAFQNDRTFAILIFSFGDKETQKKDKVSFVLTKEDVEHRRSARKANKKRRVMHKDKDRNIMPALPGEIELPPALVICGTSFDFVDLRRCSLQDLFNKLYTAEEQIQKSHKDSNTLPTESVTSRFWRLASTIISDEEPEVQLH